MVMGELMLGLMCELAVGHAGGNNLALLKCYSPLESSSPSAEAEAERSSKATKRSIVRVIALHIGLLCALALLIHLRSGLIKDAVNRSLGAVVLILELEFMLWEWENSLSCFRHVRNL